ncbi:site-specific integrase [Brachybacterium halotolerans subsp. kimchii]|uniref:tyrosine-type recombinase/integrase n=1 Tax=Brachybacterium halotolerans TaxID=2795215 RepID=UPI001E329753|nr:site-specific integrase [Brachybacterium halotolerans]UEJ83946.1 site-specific integrase [Brachybacterium halotolerans subsp. kimchii]
MATIEKRERANGTTAWRVRYRVKPGANPTVDTFDSPGQAADFAALVDRIGGEAARAKRHASVTASSLTIDDALIAYLESAPDISPGSRGEYKRILARSGLTDTLGRIPIDILEKSDVEAWVRRRSEAVSPKTIRNEHGLLSTILAHAHERGWVSSNVAKGVRLPKNHRPELEIISDEEFLALHAAMTPRYRGLIWLLGATGMRWGEATALQWRDIGESTITVRQAWKHDGEGGRVLGEPKTATSRRRIETTASVITSLGVRMKPHDYVFTNADGGPIRHNTFYRDHWNLACKKAGLDPRPTIHSLRHWAASYMLGQGADIYEVSRALGHSSITTTTRIYGHLVVSRTRPTQTHAAHLDTLLADQKKQIRK